MSSRRRDPHGSSAGGGDRRRGVKRSRDRDEDYDDYRERAEKRARLYIEESLSESVIRRCPSCGTSIVKGDGCWHMSCAVCGKDFCFLCGRRWHACAMNCGKRSVTLQRAAQRACEKLRNRYPSLTFRQCQAIIGRKWTIGDDETVKGRDDYDDDDDAQAP